MQIDTVYGSETFRGHGTASVTFGRRVGDTKTPIWQDAKDIKSGISRIRDNRQLAGPSGPCGYWYVGQYSVADSTILDLSVHVRGGRQGGAYDFGRRANMMLRMRIDASLVQIRIPFTGAPDATLSCGYIAGRFDVLSPELFEAYGLVVGRDSDYYGEEAREDFLHVSTLENGTPAPPAPTGRVVRTVAGSNVILRRTARRIR